VVEVGSKVTQWKKGDKVVTLFNQRHHYDPITPDAATSGLGGVIDGTLSQYNVFNEYGLVRAPSNLNLVEASTLSCAAVTSWNALYGLRPLKPGETVLVQGTGGVSVFALQVRRKKTISFFLSFLFFTDFDISSPRPPVLPSLPPLRTTRKARP
jgi:NADPH:quinone reductase-like Zn-dependent oxidoreductase